MLIKVSQKILEKKIIEAQKLTEELEKIQKEFEEKIEPIRNTLNKSNKEVIDLMREIDATQLVVKKVLVKLEQKKRKEVSSWWTKFTGAAEDFIETADTLKTVVEAA